MRPGRKAKIHIRDRCIDVNPIPREHFTEVATVNHRQRVKTKNAGNQTFGFDIGQTAGADSEFIVAMPLGDARAGGFDITHGEAEPLS
jgi:hypothetical protein